MNQYREDIFELFKKAYQEDSELIEPWLVNWSYQDNLKKRQTKYENELPQDFYEYNDPNDIAEWMNWLKVEKPDFFDEELINPLIERSTSFDKSLIEKHDINFDFEGYENGLARNNAQDYIMANMYPMDEPSKGRKVLDFGSGFGRQANLWCQMEDKDYLHVSMDAIPKSYCLQHFYYSNINSRFVEYVIDKNVFELNDKSYGIYHIPTWRFDLIPDNYFDRILVVQVLQELNEKLVKYVIGEFKRILKPKGALYIRDHGNLWRPAHSLDVDRYLSEKGGFTLEYKMHAIDKKEIHGIPRIWRKTNPKVKKQEKISNKQRLIEVKQKLDTLTGGKVKKIVKGILKK